jgi:WhiB family transcriptional regulator, redox-sensing transcriptional regulator
MSNLSRLPPPIADAWEWQLSGSCRSLDGSVFFAPDQTAPSLRRERETKAKAICAQCPVRPQCAAHALITRERHGIWGGFTEAERQRLLIIGWEDLADRHRSRVDITRLAARLVERAYTPVSGMQPRTAMVRISKRLRSTRKANMGQRNEDCLHAGQLPSPPRSSSDSGLEEREQKVRST